MRAIIYGKKKSAIKRSEKIGLPPGSLIYVGEELPQEISITTTEYDKKEIQIDEKKEFKDTIKPSRPNSVFWVNVEGIRNVELVEYIGKNFDLHPLLLEDVLTSHQRPKVEDYGKYLSIFLNMKFWNEKNENVEKEQVCLILKENCLLSLQNRERGVFNMIRERLKTSKGRLRTMQADFLLYALIDIIVDNYFIIIERLGEMIENLEDEIETNPGEETSQSIHVLKREIINIRKSVWPVRDVISKLIREEQEHISETTRIYFRDVQDHLIQILDNLDTFRDLMAGLRESYQSAVSNRMNQIINLLTIISTIFIPLSFLAGFYGMNFIYMPEFQNPYAYPILIIVMIGIAGTMLFFFKKKNWL